MPSNSHKSKKIKPYIFTPVTKSLAGILQRLFAQGFLKPRKGCILKYPPSNIDQAKRCAYHLNIQGHDSQKCLPLMYKNHDLTEKGDITVRQGTLSNIYNTTTNIVIIQGNLINITLRHFIRKHKAYQGN